MPSHQRGAALIVVLLFLVLIMLAGAIAVRQSTTDLRTATADQINTLLLQSADSGNQKLEAMVNANPSSQAYKDITSVSGAIGHFLLNSDNATNEFIYCYNPREKKYLAKNATILKKGGGYWSGRNSGYCDYTSADSYNSDRQTSMTQMNIAVTPPETDAEPFSQMVIGKEVENRTSKKFKFDIRATAALPAYAEPKVGSDKCFEQTAIQDNVEPGKYSLIECMREANTPSKMLYEQADVENMSSSTNCIPFGKGTGTLSSKCILTSSGR
ncbi:pilus assembly protein PilX [Moraxella osloensis]|nr:pilus assembly protein PilX [Moraxella osloensis]